MQTYLAGPINGCNDSECNDWRAFAKEHLRCPTLDPMRRDYRGRELEPGIAREIVTGDIEDIRACTFFLANCPKPSFGTAMEILLAWQRCKRVVVILPPDAIPSPWLICHSEAIVRSVTDAVAWINDRLPCQPEHAAAS